MRSSRNYCLLCIHTSVYLHTHSSPSQQAGTAFFPGSSLTGNGLLVSDGEVWKRQRRLSNAAFRKAAIQSYATAMAELADDMAMAELADDMVGGGTWGGSPAMAELADDMVGGTWTDSLVGRGGRGGRDGVVQGGVVRDVYGDFNELTMKIVVAALFGGGGLGGAAVEQVGPAISTAFDFFAKRATSMLIIPEWFPTPDNLQYTAAVQRLYGYTAAVQRLDGVVYRLIEERRKEMAGWAATRGTAQGGGDEGKDLLTRLLLARDEDGSGMDDQSLRDELMTLLVAGQETSAILLAWVCVQLALHPEEQRRAAEEVWEVLGGRSPTHADVPKLNDTGDTGADATGVTPPAYIVGRCVCRDTRLGVLKGSDSRNAPVDATGVHRGELCVPRHAPGGVALAPPYRPPPTITSHNPSVSHNRDRYLEAVIQETLRLMPPAYIVGRCACRDTRLGEWRVPHLTAFPPPSHPLLLPHQSRYLEAVIQETLRLMPPAYIVGRCACRDTRLGEWRVPHGTTVLVSPYLLHRDPEQWPSPYLLHRDPQQWPRGAGAGGGWRVPQGTMVCVRPYLLHCDPRHWPGTGPGERRGGVGRGLICCARGRAGSGVCLKASQCL
ncbi:unnamed protein product [Closterium sp. Naga37s-1]|nr:unnamed protein product [Closterium sp. Naga37s-1]